MICYVDTSAILAYLNKDDAYHGQAMALWSKALSEVAKPLCSNYVALESSALIQRRLGMQICTTFESNVRPLLQFHWVDADLHDRGVALFLASSRRNLSLTDCVSFECMRRLNIRYALSFDKHFEEQGFTLYS
ncbi:MAG: PIN domain-containing protein [Candidatus Sumerlaeota bacterium]|nr:PIN domain-containing protein [Candidatus Sumerlaeota bacterium]